jgi:glycosyltransferase involved in cell wall biosynthesis
VVTYIFNVSSPEHGGVGRYVFEMLKRANCDTESQEIDASRFFHNKTTREKLPFVLFHRKGFLKNHLDKLSSINHFLQVEMFFNFKKGKNVVTFHNSPPFAPHNSLSMIYNDFYSMSASLILYRRYSEALRTADFIIANSDHTKEGILAQKFDEDKVKTVPLGVDSKFQIATSFEERSNTLGYVGSFGRHKRVKKLLKDYTGHGRELKGYNLELWGDQGSQLQELKDKYDGKYCISFSGRMHDKNAVDVENSFRAFVFPSVRESFGLPIIEAVASGTPVFVYNDAHVPPEVMKYAHQIETVAEIPRIVEGMTDATLKRLSEQVRKEFNWDSCYLESKKIYQSL